MTTRLVKQIAGIVARELPKAGATEAATLHRVSPGARTAGNLSGGTNPTETTVACKGLVATTNRDRIGGTEVESTDRVVVLVGLGAVEPALRDGVTIAGKRDRIVGIEGSAAAWTLLCRR